MHGRFNGVQAVIREKVPEATYKVCMAHGLNTATEHSCKDCAIANMIDTTKEMFKCVTSSAKRRYVFIKNLKEHQKSSRDVDDDSNSVCPDRSTSIPLACDTRWLSHVKCLGKVKNKFFEIIKSLADISALYSSAARLVDAALKFDYLFTLVVVDFILLHTEGLHVYLQSSSIDLEQACDEASCVIRRLRNIAKRRTNNYS
jgi:hypothetical protein